ncbi:Peptidase C14, caspase catalytic [Cordyceps militaris CM01]|uniref:Peptidase C14, caspase catalytic n=2 Tax=Cordyceps militaris TaxID=73501 RepID=G3J427_CORMM|nr:Peptidase C14, caspase catalytic [Cordyceps militaris CM01]ATY64730.1 Peptidase caspase catalytic [Cordyceps militaris]EGX96598.1 Peptidase C14, caspase catalytic [Cordyceps militaris CM01]
MSSYQGQGRPQYGPPPIQHQQPPYQAASYGPPQHSPQPYPNQGQPSPQHVYYQQGQMQQQQFAYPPPGNSPNQYQQQMPAQQPYGGRPPPSPQHQHGQQQGRQDLVQAPPSAPQHFGSGAPQSYSFKYSQCTGRRKALLIGINYFGQRGQLRGCINDVRNMTSYLAEHFGYRREDMVILTDDQQNPMSQPTKQNVLRAMHWLVKDARPNDSLFFHYSGHGGQTKDLDGDEPDGYDEVIYPVDFRQHGHITDDEMHRIMVQPLCAGVRLTAIFDSCHSGTALDLPYIYSTQGILKEPNLAKEAGQGLLGVISSYSQGDLGGMGSQLVSLFKKATSGEEAHSRAIATKTSPADVVMLSGSKDDQTSADASIGLQATGAMSWAFITSLKKNPQMSYVQLLNSLRDELATRYTQKPQLSCSHPLNTDLLFVM